jgi:hypothetical protein
MAIYRGTGGAGDADNDATITEVTQQATNAAASAANAASSASSASSSATSASNSASTATTKANEASSSASNASGSASAASSSASNASNSASAASTSASNASTSVTNAQTAQTAAELAQTNAETAETNAETAETNAESFASAASTSASNASTSATAASNSASASSTSASNASDSAFAASTSASNAATSASNAQTAADTALSALDNFDDRYLGQKTSDPTLDNDGEGLVAGALYFNTTDDVMKVYDGSAWVAAYASLSGTLVAANNLSDVASVSSSRTNLGLGTAATTASTDYATAAQGALADSAVQTETNNLSTAVTWANVPDANITESSVTQHEAALSITESQVSDLGSYITGNQTITLSGDASGSGTTAITVTVADDSHNHVISNVDGLQTALDAKGTLSNVVEDTTPQLGGSLDLNSKSITGTGNISITGGMVLDSNTGYANIEMGGVSGAFIDLKSPNSDDYDGRIITSGTGVKIDSGSGGVTLSHQNSAKLNTTATGVDVIGTVTAVGLTVDTNTLHVDATNNRVGINTTTPSQALEVVGNVRLPASTTEARSIEIGAGRTGDGFTFIDLTGDATYTDYGLRLFRNSGANAGGGISSRGTGDLSITTQEAGGIKFNTTNTERMRIDSSGNVGIGTTSPSANLHISDTGEASILINADSNNDAGEESGFLEIRTDNGAIRHRVEGSGVGNNLEIIAGATGTTTAGITSNIIFKTKDTGASATERMRIDPTGNLKFDSGYGSVATAYGCRAWVNFLGSGTVAIRNSGNVSSITDIGTGRYIANFTTAMVDADFAAVCTNANKDGGCYAYATSSVRVFVGQSAQDSDIISLAIFR